MSVGLAIPKVPSRLTISPVLSDSEFEELCAMNSDLPIERTSQGEIVVNAPAGFGTSDGNAEIVFQLRTWWKQHRLGRVTDSSLGTFLPDGSSLNPDAAYITQEQLAGLRPEDLDHFLHFAPAFVIELRSKSDSLRDAKDKMVNWINNGAQLGWLIDPYSKTVHVYEPESEPHLETGNTVSGTGPVAGFVLDLEEVWHSYEI